MGKAFCQRARDTPAPRTKIENPTPLSCGRGAGGEAVDHFFGFRPGNEHIRGHRYAAAAEVGVTDDMLDRTVLFEVFERPMETQQVALDTTD